MGLLGDPAEVEGQGDHTSEDEGAVTARASHSRQEGGRWAVGTQVFVFRFALSIRLSMASMRRSMVKSG